MAKRRAAVPGHAPPKAMWVLFDHSNGLDGSKNYLFWFKTRTKAMAYKRDLDRRRARGESVVQTTGPVMYVCEDEWIRIA